MTLFEQLKLFPKLDLHVDFFGSITRDTIQFISGNLKDEELEDLLTSKTIEDYENTKLLVTKLLDSFDNIEKATSNLIQKLKKDNIIYAEIFLDLSLINKELILKDIINTILKEIKKEEFKANLVLVINKNISKDELEAVFPLLSKFYLNGINGLYFKNDKKESIDLYQSLFDKLVRNDIKYIVDLDGELTNQTKEIYYNASRIIYNLLERPDNNFLNILHNNKTLLEFPVTFQFYNNLYEDLANHFIYDLYKENINICLTTVDMTFLDTDLLNEYCKLFNVFPFNLHDLIKILIFNINVLNIDDDLRSQLIDELKEKANELL